MIIWCCRCTLVGGQKISWLEVEIHGWELYIKRYVLTDMSKKYLIYLNNIFLGFTHLEAADAPMGVVTGKILIEYEGCFYTLIRDYCKNNEISVNEDNPALEAIFTQSIAGLKVVNDGGVEIKGQGAIIQGFKEEGYEIDIFGIPYPFYDEEFPHHREAYESMYK